MPRSRLTSYLATYRQKAALTQRELGELLGLTNAAVSGYEREVSPVSARVLIACQLIFGVEAAALFPALVDEVEDELGARIVALLKQLDGRTDRASRKKRDVLLAVPERIRKAAYE